MNKLQLILFELCFNAKKWITILFIKIINIILADMLHKILDLLTNFSINY